MKKYETEIEVTKFTDQELYHYISELSAQLGGMRLNFMSRYDGMRMYTPAGSRCGYLRQGKPRVRFPYDRFYPPYECFGNKVPYARPKAQYLTLGHFTIATCKRSCWLRNTVICVRGTKSGRKYLTIHTAGECPYTHYKE